MVLRTTSGFLRLHLRTGSSLRATETSNKQHHRGAPYRMTKGGSNNVSESLMKHKLHNQNQEQHANHKDAQDYPDPQKEDLALVLFVRGSDAHHVVEQAHDFQQNSHKDRVIWSS